MHSLGRLVEATRRVVAGAILTGGQAAAVTHEYRGLEWPPAPMTTEPNPTCTTQE